MSKLEQFKGGFSVHGRHPIETVEWILDSIHSTDSKLCFQAYDANLCPTPMFSTWGDGVWKQKQIAKALEVTKDFHGAVKLDDVVIKGGVK